MYVCRLQHATKLAGHTRRVRQVSLFINVLELIKVNIHNNEGRVKLCFMVKIVLQYYIVRKELKLLINMLRKRLHKILCSYTNNIFNAYINILNV